MRSIIQHLRFPFSFLLLPVFLMAVVMSFPFSKFNWEDTLLLFTILHLLVYPSSNAYNSLQDKDEGSIGLIKKPLHVHPALGPISMLMDIAAIGLAQFISLDTAIYITIYIIVSRLYSYRKIRLKQYPIIGFLVVFIFQGAWTYFLTVTALGDQFTFDSNKHLWFAVSASCLIGAIYPLSQIYQHKTDKADGVITISYLLGKSGTFIFSGLLFLLGAFLFCYPIYHIGDILYPLLFLCFQIPSLIYFKTIGFIGSLKMKMKPTSNTPCA